MLSKKRNTFMIIFTLALMTCFFIMPGQSAAQTDKGQFGPLNPTFEKYLAEQASDAALRANGYTVPSRMVTADGHGLGHIPPAVKLPPTVSSLSSKDIQAMATSIPTSFDLRTSSPVGVTPVKDQHQCGSCWAFAAMGSLESHLLYKLGTTASFSEDDLNEYHGFSPWPCQGGGWDMSTGYFARWAGPESEGSLPYPYWFRENGTEVQAMSLDTPSPPPPTRNGATPGVPAKYHIQNVYWLSNAGHPLTSAERTVLKTAVYNNGGVDIAFNIHQAEPYLHGNNYYDPNADGTNHEVTIVGWIDAYSASHFGYTPPGNGAFIVKNSWGTGWGDHGYFYMSYYDKSLEIGAQYNGIEPTTNYKRIYQYDRVGVNNSYGWVTDNIGWMANTFMASASAPVIKAVSFYTFSPSCPYEIRLYSNITPGSPRSGSLVRTATGTITNAGYHTVTITPTAVTANKPFSVVVKLTVPGSGGYPLPIQTDSNPSVISNVNGALGGVPGMTYVSHDGATWYEANSAAVGVYFIACLKAFGDIQ